MATSEMEIRTALDRHCAASAAGDLEAEHDIYRDVPFATIPSPANAFGADATSKLSAGITPTSLRGSRCGELWVQGPYGLPSTSSRIVLPFVRWRPFNRSPGERASLATHRRH